MGYLSFFIENWRFLTFGLLRDVHVWNLASAALQLLLFALVRTGEASRAGFLANGRGRITWRLVLVVGLLTRL